MGFFNGLLKGLGFEGNSKKPEIKEETTKSAPINPSVAKYNLDKLPTNKEVKTFVPNNQQEVQQIVDILKQGEVVSVDFQLIHNSEYVRALDFMSGATYVLNGKIQKVENKVFLFYPNVRE